MDSGWQNISFDMGVSTLITMIRAMIFLSALLISLPHALAKNSLSLSTEIAINMMQYVEWENHGNKAHTHTLCILNNKTITDEEFNIGKLRVIFINDHLIVSQICDGLLVEKEFNYLIPAISLIDNKKNTLIIGTLNNSLSNGAHFSLIREGDIFRIHGNSKRIKSSRIIISSKLLRLVKMD